jgi:hypothetical protein
MEGMVQEKRFETGFPDRLDDLSNAVVSAFEIPFPKGYSDSSGFRSACVARGVSRRSRTDRGNEKCRIGNDFRGDGDFREDFGALFVAHRYGRRSFENAPEQLGIGTRNVDSHAEKYDRFLKKPGNAGPQPPLENLLGKRLSLVVVKNSAAADYDKVGAENFPSGPEEKENVRNGFPSKTVRKISKIPDSPFGRNERARGIVGGNRDAGVGISFAKERDLREHDGFVAEIVGSSSRKDDDSAEGHGRKITMDFRNGWGIRVAATFAYARSEARMPHPFLGERGFLLRKRLERQDGAFAHRKPFGGNGIERGFDHAAVVSHGGERIRYRFAIRIDGLFHDLLGRIRILFGDYVASGHFALQFDDDLKRGLLADSRNARNRFFIAGFYGAHQSGNSEPKKRERRFPSHSVNLEKLLEKPFFIRVREGEKGFRNVGDVMVKVGFDNFSEARRSKKERGGLKFEPKSGIFDEKRDFSVFERQDGSADKGIHAREIIGLCPLMSGSISGSSKASKNPRKIRGFFDSSENRGEYRT